MGRARSCSTRHRRQAAPGVGDTVRIAASGPARSFRVVGTARFGSVKSIGVATAALFDLRTAQQLFGEPGRSTRSSSPAGRAPRRPRCARRSPPRCPHGRRSDRAGPRPLHPRRARARSSGSSRPSCSPSGRSPSSSAGSRSSTRCRSRSRSAPASSGCCGWSARGAAGPGQRAGRGARRRPAGLGRRPRGGRRPGRGPRRPAEVDRRRPAAERPGRHRRDDRRLARRRRPRHRAGRSRPAWKATRSRPSPRCATSARTARARASSDVPCARSPASSDGPPRLLGGSAGTLARRNAMRNPGRVAATAAAMTIGVALVTAVTVSRRASRTRRPAACATGSPPGRSSSTRTAGRPSTPRSSATSRRARRPDDVEHRAGRRARLRPGGGHQHRRPGHAAAGLRLRVVARGPGGARRAARDGAIVDSGWAKEHGLAVGGRFTLTSAAGRDLRLSVRGIEKSPVLDMLGLGPITITRSAARERRLRRHPRALHARRRARRRHGALPARWTAIPRCRSRPATPTSTTRPSRSTRCWRSSRSCSRWRSIVSLFGLVNALVLATFERTRSSGRCARSG